MAGHTKQRSSIQHDLVYFNISSVSVILGACNSELSLAIAVKFDMQLQVRFYQYVVTSSHLKAERSIIAQNLISCLILGPMYCPKAGALL